jgi:hypothetical protein
MCSYHRLPLQEDQADSEAFGCNVRHRDLREKAPRSTCRERKERKMLVERSGSSSEMIRRPSSSKKKKMSSTRCRRRLFLVASRERDHLRRRRLPPPSLRLPVLFLRLARRLVPTLRASTPTSKGSPKSRVRRLPSFGAILLRPQGLKSKMTWSSQLLRSKPPPSRRPLALRLGNRSWLWQMSRTRDGLSTRLIKG